MSQIFRSTADKRFRAGWRILFFILIFWTFSTIALAVKPLLGELTKREYVSDYSIIIVSILAIAASIAVPLSRKFFDKHSFISLGITLNKKAATDLLFGFLLSGVMAAAVFGVMVLFGIIDFHGFNIGANQTAVGTSQFVKYMSIISLGSLAILLLETILVGYWEELVFRGYLYQNMVEGMGVKISVLISCVIYGLLHATNPNATLLSSLIIVLFGFLRIYGYMATKMLWLSIGMHIGWNFFQGPIFGYAASGHQKATLIDQSPISQDWLSGGAFGPEGSVIIIPILIGALVIMKWWSTR